MWSILGNISWRGLSAISTIIIARILGPSQLGELGMIQSTISVFSVFAGFRLGSTATKYVAEFRRTDPLRAARVLKLTLFSAFVICFIIGMTCLLFSGRIASLILGQPKLSMALAIGSVYLFFTVYGAVQEFALAGFESFKSVAVAGFVRGLLSPLLCIPLTYLFGLNGTIAGLTLVALGGFGVLSLYLRREKKITGCNYKIPLRDTRPDVKILWNFALPGFLVGLIMSAVPWFGRVLLTKQQQGFTELGLFTAAEQWRLIILFLPSLVARVALPMLSQTYSQKYRREFNNTFSIQLEIICMITLPLSILIIGFSKYLALVFGKQYAGIDAIIPILMASVFLFAFNTATRTGLDSSGRRWNSLFMYSAWAIAFLSSCYFFVPIFGATGLAITYLFAELVLSVLHGVYLDVVLIKGIIRRSWVLLLMSLILLIFSVLSQIFMPIQWRNPFSFIILLLSLLPCIIRIKATTKQNRKNHDALKIPIS